MQGYAGKSGCMAKFATKLGTFFLDDRGNAHFIIKISASIRKKF